MSNVLDLNVKCFGPQRQMFWVLTSNVLDLNVKCFGLNIKCFGPQCQMICLSTLKVLPVNVKHLIFDIIVKGFDYKVKKFVIIGKEF